MRLVVRGIEQERLEVKGERGREVKRFRAIESKWLDFLSLWERT